MKNKILISIMLVLIAVLIFMISLLFPSDKEVIIKNDIRIPVEVEEVITSEEESFLRYSALIQTKNMEQVSFTDIQEIEQIYVSVGDEVEKGQLLVKLDDTEAKDNYNLAKDNYKDAEDDLDEAKDVYDEAKELNTGVPAAKEAYYLAKDRYDFAKRTYDEADRALDETSYRAKNDGIVLVINASVGSTTNPFFPVMVLGSEDFVAEFGISASDFYKVYKEQPASIILNGTTYEAYVDSIEIVPDTTTRTYLTSIAFEEEITNLLLGDFCEVEIALGQHAGIWIDITSLLNDGVDYVYVIEDERALRKNVEIIEINNEKVLVRGLSDGDLLVTKGTKSIKSGELVNVVE